MANESTYALISDVLPDIWEGALFYAQHSFVMPRLVTAFTDQTGMVPRKVTDYTETAVTDSLTETADLSTARVAFDRDLLRTLTPKEIGKQILMTDRRVESDLENVMVDAARDIGYTMGKKLEQDLLGEFAGFTGGIFGGSGSAMSMDVIFAGRSRLEAAAIPGPYFVVLHPYQYFDLWSANAALSSPAPLDVRNQSMQSYYISQIADVSVIVSSLVPTVTEASEVQTVTVTGTPTGGTFTLKLAEQETATIAYDSTAAAAELVIEALANVGAGNGTCAGGDFPGTAVTVTFSGTLAGQNMPLMTLGTNSLTGGTTPTVTIAETTAGANYARGAIFTRDSLALDLRRGLRVEPERDASLRATELNASMIYAASEWRADRGVILKSDASTPLV